MDLMLYKKAASFLTKFYSDRKSLQKEGAPITKLASPAHLPIHHPFPRVMPESVGVESGYLHAFLSEYASMTELSPHSLMIMKDGGIICETDFYPYHRDTWHVSHSLCKSITALAVGLLVDDGLMSLDEKLVDIFPKRTFNLDAGKQKEITIRHLLNMSAGVAFNEMGSALTEDWIEGFFGAGIKFQPGTKFMYNSMNSFMLSAAIREKTGKDMFELLSERIFHPMEISEIYWEKCPKGITKGGWGLYMKIEDLMKFATLFLEGGTWNGKRLISEDWVREMTKKQIDTPECSNKYGYGFQVWGSVREGSYQFNGMLGQNLIIFPDIKMAIATYSGSAEFFPNCALMSLIDRYFGAGFKPSAAPLKPSRRAAGALLKYCSELSLPPVKGAEGKKTEAALIPFVGKRYHLGAENVSVLPVLMSVFHGNFSEGIDHIRFSAEKERLFVSFEGKKEVVGVPFAFDGSACYFDYFENGEHFYAASMAKMTKNEDDVPVLKLSVYFLETTSARHIKFFFHRNKTVVRFSETPTGVELLTTYAPVLEEAVSKNKAVKNVLSRFDFGLVDYNVERLFSPFFEATECE